MPMVKRLIIYAFWSTLSRVVRRNYSSKSHGNAKDKKKPFFPTKKTVLKGIKSQQTRKEMPKETLQQLT